MKYEPRDYQLEGYHEIMRRINAGYKSILYVLPTRGGKSGVISQLIEYFSKTRPIYYMCHTKILLDQMSDELGEHEIKHGIISPDHPEIQYRTQVISKDTLRNRMDRMKNTWKKPAVIIIDEAHLAAAKTFQDIITNYPDTIIIGFTGSPCRLDGKSLGDIFETMIEGPDIPELQRRQILCPIETFVAEFDDSGMRKTAGDYNKKDVDEKVNKSAILKDVFNHWSQFAAGKKTLTFCASVEHAENMAREFSENGVPAVAISSKDHKNVIRQKLDNFYSGKYLNLCSVNLFLMGFHVRDCECIIQARPTMSLMIYLQSLGRGEMFMPGKTLINLDCVNNYARHGLPDESREWTIETVKKIKEKSKYKRCPECLHPIPVASRLCEYCGAVPIRDSERQVIPEELEGKLIKIGDNETHEKPGRKDTVRLIAKYASNLGDAQEICKRLGYKAGYAFFVWTKILKNKVA